ncbi:MAG: DUF1577 domain-containing protein [Spirochaetota bacterium]|nr:DUF1577 domain-containing protein [Spirochaetota bacterium]
MKHLKTHEKREFADVTDPKQISYLIEQYLDKKKVFVKGLPLGTTAELEILYPNPVAKLTFKEPLPQDYIRDEITIFTVVKRYIEISLVKSSFDRTTGEFELVNARIANSVREDPRIDVRSEDFFAENFRLSKYSINKNMKSAPICVQVSFDALRPKIIEEFPNCTLNILEEDVYKKDVHAVLKTQRILYIKDVHDPITYASSNSDFLDYGKYLGLKFDQEFEALNREDIKSLLVYPIIYTNLYGEKTSIGYFKMISKNDFLSEHILSRLKEYSHVLSSNVRDSNTQIIKEAHKVVNISRKGIQIQVKDPKFVSIFQSNKNEVVLDVKPKPTFRLSLFAKIATITKGNDNIYNIGMQFIGGESIRGLSDWQNFVNKLVM